jgi:hypothetical protein
MKHKPPDDPEQSKRFIEAARLAGADEDQKSFDRAFDRVDTKSKSPKAEKSIRKTK